MRHRTEWAMGLTVMVVTVVAGLLASVFVIRERQTRPSRVFLVDPTQPAVPGKPVGTDNLTSGPCQSFYAECCEGGASWPTCASPG